MLPDNKKTMMYTRLVRRLRMLKLPDFRAYIERVEKEIRRGGQEELLFMVNAMTTNVTSFFRENHHFEHLAKNLGALCDKFGQVCIWSSACSTGQEPWSIAMVVAEHLAAKPQDKIKIIATDIDSSVLTVAQKGEYLLKADDVKANPRLRKWLKVGREADDNILQQSVFHVDERLKGLVSFAQMNLLKPWTLREKTCHVVFCRNVIIYFSKDTQRGLFVNMERQMPAGGLLYLGHSESLLGVSTAYETKGQTIYIKKDISA